jgi:SET domain-containing protein
MKNVSMFADMGRGLESSQLILKDSIVECSELLVLSEVDTKIVNTTDLKYYTFKYNDKQDCLVMGLGEIFNHSDTPNVSYSIELVNGREMMVFKALNPIKQGEQLFIDYNHDTKVNTDLYKINLI